MSSPEYIDLSYDAQERQQGPRDYNIRWSHPIRSRQFLENLSSFSPLPNISEALFPLVPNHFLKFFAITIAHEDLLKKKQDAS